MDRSRPPTRARPGGLLLMLGWPMRWPNLLRATDGRGRLRSQHQTKPTEINQFLEM